MNAYPASLAEEQRLDSSPLVTLYYYPCEMWSEDAIPAARSTVGILVARLRVEIAQQQSKQARVSRTVSKEESHGVHSYREKAVSHRFHVALSFPGEHRSFVLAVAQELAAKLSQERVFYDEWYEAELLGTGGDLKLQEKYMQADLIVPFFSRDYSKPWCSMEWETIRGILLTRRKDDAVIPVHLDDTDIPGWPVVNFGIRLRGRTPQQISDVILQALAVRNANTATAASTTSPLGVSPATLHSHPGTVPTTPTSSTPPQSGALAIWREKLDYFRTQEAISSDASQKFTLKKQMEEAEAKIAELERESVRGGLSIVGESARVPEHRLLLVALERALRDGELRDSELGPLVLTTLSDEHELSLNKPFDATWITTGIRLSDMYFALIRPSAGHRDWQRDFAKVSTPILVGVTRSLQRSPDAQATILRLCEVLAQRLRLQLVWPSEPDASNDLRNAVYRTCLQATEVESDDVLAIVQTIRVVGPT